MSVATPTGPIEAGYNAPDHYQKHGRPGRHRVPHRSAHPTHANGITDLQRTTSVQEPCGLLAWPNCQASSTPRQSSLWTAYFADADIARRVLLKGSASRPAKRPSCPRGSATQLCSPLAEAPQPGPGAVAAMPSAVLAAPCRRPGRPHAPEALSQCSHALARRLVAPRIRRWRHLQARPSGRPGPGWSRSARSPSVGNRSHAAASTPVDLTTYRAASMSDRIGSYHVRTGATTLVRADIPGMARCCRTAPAEVHSRTSDEGGNWWTTWRLCPSCVGRRLRPAAISQTNGCPAASTAMTTTAATPAYRILPKGRTSRRSGACRTYPWLSQRPPAAEGRPRPCDRPPFEEGCPSPLVSPKGGGMSAEYQSRLRQYANADQLHHLTH